MKPNWKKCRQALLLSGVLLLCSASLRAQSNEMERFQVDSVLYKYYQHCKSNLLSPVVISMSDTLFRQAEQKGDKRMQAVALSTILDYYYYQGIQDSVIAWTDRVKEFALKTDQPKYYFFAWGKRLVQFYTKTGKLNTAFFETEKMLADAQRMDNKDGIASCYNTLSNIYKVRGLEEMTKQCRLKEVELIRKYDLDAYNLTLAYTDIASYYLSAKKMDEAFDAIVLADSAVLTNQHKLYALQLYLRYYLLNEEPQKALNYLKIMQKLIDGDPALATNRKTLYEAEYNYYLTTRQYPEALRALSKREEELDKLGEEAMLTQLQNDWGNAYYLKQDYQKAAEYYRKYITTKDSLSMQNEKFALSELATLLGMEKLNVEKNEYALKVKENQLRSNLIIIILLLGLLGIVTYFLYRGFMMNKKLRTSETKLINQNTKLIESEEKLNLAKEKAEQASLMKSVFIRNMTHEIRTPLNSIVGFSQVITDMLDKDSEAHEFANIIKENNQKLLKLVDDVLDMSDLESGKQVDISDTDINRCCEESIKLARPYLNEGVELEFLPQSESLMAMANSGRIMQVLFNLLHNAAKVTREGSITLAYTVKNNQIVFTVTDTGPGIAPEKQEDVFERFVKVDDFTQGFGLGLSISRLLAQRMGGSLVIDREYTGGSRFIFTIPLIPTDLAE